MIYNEMIGDLFDTPMDYALAHCISKDCEMAAGIALQFVKRYPHMKRTLLSKDRKISDALFYEEKYKHVVFNLITKEKYYHKPKRQDFESSILNLKSELSNLSMDKLAVPLLGAGLDRLDWNISSDFIKQCFANTSVQILVIRLQ